MVSSDCVKTMQKMRFLRVASGLSAQILAKFQTRLPMGEEVRHLCNAFAEDARFSGSDLPSMVHNALSQLRDNGFLPERQEDEANMNWRALSALLLGVSLAGCMSGTYAPAPETAMTSRDRQLLANPPYAKVKPQGQYARHVVAYPSNRRPGTIVVDTPNKFLYYVDKDGKAIRYGVTVGEESLAFRGQAKVGRKAEWPSWTPTPEIHQRIAGLPSYVGPGPHNPMGARALYLYQGSRDTLFRIHGTNQPELLGQAISSGCIRMLNEDVIDLYSRVPVGAEVVVL